MTDRPAREGRMPAIFLDRDGTLIEDDGYVRDPEAVRYLPGVFDALKRVARSHALFLVTNQVGVGEGHLTLEEADRVNRGVANRLAAAGAPLRAVYMCPHGRTEACACRKPNPHFLHRAAEEHGIDLARSFAIGDHPHDVAFAENAGARGLYVLTGHGRKHRAELAGAVTVCADLDEAAGIILAASPAAGPGA